MTNMAPLVIPVNWYLDMPCQNIQEYTQYIYRDDNMQLFHAQVHHKSTADANLPDLYPSCMINIKCAYRLILVTMNWH